MSDHPTKQTTGIALWCGSVEPGDYQASDGRITGMDGPDTKQTTDPDLAAFVATLRHDVDRFEANWMAQQKAAPALWPDRMGEADWHEQFIMFLSAGDE